MSDKAGLLIGILCWLMTFGLISAVIADAIAGEGELAGFAGRDCTIGPTGTDSLSIVLQCARRDDALPQKQKEMRRHVAKQWRYQHRCCRGLA
jgi:hypothetical protein